MVYKEHKIENYEYRFSPITVGELEELLPSFTSFAKSGDGEEKALAKLSSYLWKHLDLKVDGEWVKMTDADILNLYLNEDTWIYLAIAGEFNEFVMGLFVKWQSYQQAQAKIKAKK